MNGVIKKRKSKRGSKNRNWKRSKISTETSFDSPQPESFIQEFKQALSLTPSKSEFSAPEAPNLTPSKSEYQVESPNIWCDKSFGISSEEEVSGDEASVLDQFMDFTSCNTSAEVVAAEVCTKVKEKKPKKSPAKTKPIPATDEPSNTFNQDQLCYTGDGIIVLLAKNQTIHFHGLCLLTVLHGQVEVLGHILSKDSPEAPLYSPRGSALLYLQNITDSDIPVANYLSNLKLKTSERCAILLCKKLHDSQITFIEKHISQQILPREDVNLPRVVFEPQEGNWNLLKINPNWVEIIERVNQTTKMMICGGKGVGKTTFLRYAINTLLMRFSEVRVIDLDPGQAEFTVPGCISIVRVEKPVFGVNYTHLRRTERTIISNINIAYEPERYIASVRQLLEPSLDEIPTLINYMGYTHGIGINILSATIATVQPTDILQITSQDPKKNYKLKLERSVVEENAELFVQTTSKCSYILHEIQSMSDQNNSWTAEPRQLREMCVLAFVSQMVRSDSIFKTSAPLYRINMNDIALSDLKGNTVHPAAINACLVALCTPEQDTFRSLGWGIVRGIDLSSNELILLTSTNFEVLDQVTHLVSGGAALPPSLYMTPEDVVGPMPYVIEGDLVSFGQITKRSRVAVKSV